MGMRRLGPQVAAVALTVLVCFLGTHSTPTADAQTAPAKPNFVFILADDMRKDHLRYMPKTRSLLGDGGMSFANAYVSNALCCPSRATIMRGQYAHNTGVWSNVPSLEGGWESYKLNGNEQDNVATRLHAAGYRTALIGKYLNDDYKSTTYVPPGWDKWFATFEFEYFDYDINANGTIRHFGTAEGDYSPTSSSGRHETLSPRAAVPSSPTSPHRPARPRHTGPARRARLRRRESPRLPSFNERDVSDKPPWIRSLPRLRPPKSPVWIASTRAVESLQALDDLVEAWSTSSVRKESSQTPTSSSPPTTASSVRAPHTGNRAPVRERLAHAAVSARPRGGGGLEHGQARPQHRLLADLHDLAGIPTPDYVDGRSLRPVLEGNATTWRSAILLESQ
jgi:hypothetical protein